MEGYQVAIEGKTQADNRYIVEGDECHFLEWRQGFHDACAEYDL